MGNVILTMQLSVDGVVSDEAYYNTVDTILIG